MHQQQRLFPAPLRRVTTFIVRPEEDGYLALTVNYAGSVPGSGLQDFYDSLTTNEVLDVVESTLGLEFGFVSEYGATAPGADAG